MDLGVSIQLYNQLHSPWPASQPGSEGCLKIKGFSIQKPSLGRPPPLIPEGAGSTKQEESLLFAPKRAWFPSLYPSRKRSTLTALGRVRRAGEGEPTHDPVSQGWARNGALFASHVSQMISRNFKNGKSLLEKEIQACALPVSSWISER